MTYTDTGGQQGKRTLDEQSTSVFLAVLEAAGRKNLLVTPTKLTKLLYLLDLGQIAAGRELATTIEWRWRHHGPYSDVLYYAEEKLSHEGYISSEEHQWANTRGRVLKISHSNYLPPARDVLEYIDEVIERFGSLTPTQIKDFTYQTAPMLAAQRGGEREVVLDMNLARPRMNLQKISARYAMRRANRPKSSYDDSAAQGEVLRVIAESATTRDRANGIVSAWP